MEKIFEKINILITNAKKSLGKPYTTETIQAKRKEIDELGIASASIFDNGSWTVEEKQSNLNKFSELRKDALNILSLHEDKLTQGSSTQTIGTIVRNPINMAEENLNAAELASISKLISTFEGTKTELNQFLANLEILRDTFPTNKRVSFFNFVYKTRLTLKVQNRIRQTRIPTCIDTLITTLKEIYKPKKSPNVILNELTRITQTESIQKFADRIEQLTMELNEIQISTLGEENRSVICETNATIAFNSFKNGLSNREIVRTLEASRVKKLNEAIEIATEVSADIRQNQIMFQTSQPRNKVRNFYNNRNSNNTNYSHYRNNNFSRSSNGNRYPNNNNNRFYNNSQGGNNYNNRTNHSGVNNSNRGNYMRNNNNHGHNNNNRDIDRDNNRSNSNNNTYRNSNNYRNNNIGRNAYCVQEQGNGTNPEVAYHQVSSDQSE